MTTSSKTPGNQAPALDFTSCPDWGRGGSYIYDPVSKKRIRAEADPATGAAQEKNLSKAASAGKAAAETKE